MQTFECSYPPQVRSGGEMIDFHPESDASHRRLLDRMIDKYRSSHPDASDAQLDSIDAERHVAVLVDRTVTVVEQGDRNRLPLRLAASECSPSAGPKVAERYEKRYPGFYLTEFHPYSGKALLERMTDKQATARGILAGNLKIKPWDVRVTPTKEGGWSCKLDQTIIYQPDKMDKSIQQACEQIGHLGWWFEADAKTGIIVMHPGEPANFEPVHPLPPETLGAAENMRRTPFGVLLPRAGGLPFEPASIDWKEGSFLLIGGEGGSGKSVFTNVVLAEQIAQGVELTIVDTKSKSTDYFWCRPWVKYWGCESIVQACGCLNHLVWEMEHGERAKAWAENAWQSWYDIPDWAKRKFPIHVIVIDEYASLVDEAQMCKSVPNPEKTLPPVLQQAYKGYAEYMIRHDVIRILRLARFMGYRLILASQTVSQASGLPPNIRDLFTHRVAMGPNPSESLEKGVFHDLAGMPTVPANVIDSGNSKGVGRAELAGMTGCVFKTYWAGRDGMVDTEVFGHMLADKVGLPNWCDRDRYFNTIAKHTADDPIDAEYMHELTNRIAIGESKAIASDPILQALKDAWDESEMNFGGSADEGPAKPAADAAGVAPPAPAPAGTGAQLMDASQLADLMGGRG